MAKEESLHVCWVSVQHNVDIGITHFPGFLKVVTCVAVTHPVEMTFQLIERSAECTAPFLLPAPSAIAAAIRATALDAMNTTPGAVLVDLYLPFGGMEFEILTIIGELNIVTLAQFLEYIGQR